MSRAGGPTGQPNVPGHVPQAARRVLPPQVMAQGLMALRTVSIDGEPMPALETRIEQVVDAGGTVIEREHQSVVILGDGTLVSGLGDRGIRQCAGCERDRQASGLHDPNAIAKTLHAADCLLDSDEGGQALCKLHRCRVRVNGVVRILSHEEAEGQHRRWQRKHPIRAIFAPHAFEFLDDV